MFNPDLHKEMKNITVKELCEHLQTLPQDAKIVVDGDEYFHIHVEYDNSVVDLDDSAMEDEYPESVNSI
jgi:hypothetical protein